MAAGNTKIKMQLLTLKVPDELARDLERIAAQSGLSKSQVAREALTRYVAATVRKNKTFASALDMAGDLVGAVKRAPPGLATDPKYLDDFGTR